MVFENAFVFTYKRNSKLNPIELSNNTPKFCSTISHQPMFIMFSKIEQLNCIISSKTMKEYVTYPCDVSTNTIL